MLVSHPNPVFEPLFRAINDARFGSNTAFNPDSLFTGGFQGAWYDFSDLSTMFQDSAGTIPVTADGDPVGKILDNSGNGNHATQSTSSARPLYKTSGGLHWLEFDGVDDALVTGSINFTASDKITVFTGAEASSSSTKIFLELSAATGAFPGSFYITDSESVNNLGTYRMYGSIFAGGNLTSAPPSLSVMTFAFDIGGDSVSVRSNGSAAAGNMSVGSDAGTGNFGNWPLYIAARSGNSLQCAVKIYQLCIVGKTASGTEITNTETFINGKTGAY
jgi:hypothetical protein